jgi:hypothetical protein
LEAVNSRLLAQLAHIERLTVPKEKQLIQFAEDAVDDVLPWDMFNAKPKAKKSPLQEGDESLDNIVLPKPGDKPVEF